MPHTSVKPARSRGGERRVPPYAMVRSVRHPGTAGCGDPGVVALHGQRPSSRRSGSTGTCSTRAWSASMPHRRCPGRPGCTRLGDRHTYRSGRSAMWSIPVAPGSGEVRWSRPGLRALRDDELPHPTTSCPSTSSSIAGRSGARTTAISAYVAAIRTICVDVLRALDGEGAVLHREAVTLMLESCDRERDAGVPSAARSSRRSTQAGGRVLRPPRAGRRRRSGRLSSVAARHGAPRRAGTADS